MRSKNFALARLIGKRAADGLDELTCLGRAIQIKEQVYDFDTQFFVERRALKSLTQVFERAFVLPIARCVRPASR
jgi:hypothetical protein